MNSKTESRGQSGRRVALRRLAWAAFLVLLSGNAMATADSVLWWRCDGTQPAPAHTRHSSVQLVPIQPGPLKHAPSPSGSDPATPQGATAIENQGSWQFDGQTSIVHTIPSDTAGFESDFTWEGFFLSPSSNRYLPETGISDRLVTQFAFDKGNWTRLALGLVADDEGRGRLSVSLEGFDGRTFGLGQHPVAADRWHHFALVHEGTPSAARIRWYLDHQLTGELFLGGQSNQNTLRPAGTAPFTFGARLRQGKSVNRGFAGLLDELRLTPRPLDVTEFLTTIRPTSTERVELQQELAAGQAEFWSRRHEWAHEQSRQWAPPPTARSSIDALWPDSREPIDDAAFLRRLSLTVRGRIPDHDEVVRFLADERIDRRQHAIERLLASDEWADSWVGYWQDVLAENPSVVFPTLNNSGAFRQWIDESFRNNQPFDRFATELLLLEDRTAAGVESNGTAGFALATGNDAPMAMRSHVALQAFAAVDLKCARCHDSPVDDFQQSDLFLLAAYLNNGPLEVPQTSVAAAQGPHRSELIKTSLVAGQQIDPVDLRAFWLSDIERPGELRTADLRPVNETPRGQLAALITAPHNPRFSDVIVNRVWQRYFGAGLIEPVDRWSVPAAGKDGLASDDMRLRLLRTLSAEFVESGYDLKWLARRILSSQAWQARRPRRQLMSAEQLVDSLFRAVGKDFQAETMGVHATDPGAVQLPRPQRAWQFAALPNERDRPALGMPVNQTIVDVMTTFGWTGARQQPRSVRDQSMSALQPLMLSNGLVAQRIVRLSESSRMTTLSLEADRVEELVESLFLAVLGRRPDATESKQFDDYLRPGFETRRTGQPARPVEPLSTFQPDWRKHLEAEQTRLMLEAQQRVAAGEPPTVQLTDDFRERVEDVVWALLNSPEFVVIP